MSYNQSATTGKPLAFLLVLSSDHISGATGKTPTVTISKNGGAYAAPAGAVTELGNGNYLVAPNPSDTNTLGPLLLHATASGCDPRDDVFDVVNYNPEAVRVLSPSPGPSSYTARNLVESAASELGITGQGQTLPPEDAAVFIDQLNRLVDDFNAIREAIFATDFLTFTMVPSTNPHTIGPSGANWTVTTSRPVQIEQACVILSSGPTGVNAPFIRMHDQNVGWPLWQASLSTPNISTSYPTDGYYDATWPNGSLYLWPVPSSALNIQLQVRQVLTDYSLNTSFTLPPGYRSALTLTLAENCAAIFQRQMPPTLERRALMARIRIFENNIGAGRIATQDAGMPRGRRGRDANWNYLTGPYGNGH